MPEAEEPSKLMFIMHRPPHGSIHAYEGLEFVLISAAYEQDVSLVFIGDGVLALKKDQDTSELGIKGFVKTYRTLDDYDVEKVYVDRESLEERGLKVEDLIVDVMVKERKEISQMMEEQHALFPF